MSVKIHTIALLLLSLYLCWQLSAARHAPRRRPCCVLVTSRNMSADVVGQTYREQPAGSPCVKAIIFHTNDGPLCADPKAQWVKDLAANMTKV
ncbi:C-C motif chemokine 3 [Maylandia zebra]|uniref:C-C motif chemokine 2 n=1 Tax=Maylandia zebra TaxID=106582 RepID=A0A3P9CU02_9CICH|nr:C-C motif chemokine 2 [Maylandia zebra]XP_026036074.1 C-C motif chemokine 2-like [Astatotilapia calliptera]